MEEMTRRAFVGAAAIAGGMAAAGASTALASGNASEKGDSGSDAQDEALSGQSLADAVRQLQAQVHDLQAKQAIRDKLALYARGLDRQDPDIAKAAFAEDSVVDYGTSPDYGEVFKGSGWDWCDYCAYSTDRDAISAGGGLYDHRWYQSTITVDGDKAGSESYEGAVVMSPNGDGTYSFMDSVARNCDKWECRDGDWVIVERVVTNDLGWSFPSCYLNTPYGATMDKTDPSYEALAFGQGGE